jgi:hypothetical protein
MEKVSKTLLERIIKEEISAAKKDYARKLYENNSVSSVEIEELLRTYFHRVGGVPDDIFKLSVLFPVMEKAGLSSFVESYMELKKNGSTTEEAKEVLRDVKRALLQIRNDKFE